ncbi:uroporphyrinogen-III synthase [Acidocella aminolytica]|uniref:Uroporphyrinogen III synthase n=1 Tax=Acidocella aminolytica 101 = DSM 11237 TaxID=1120923 RepID=A0A0D6PI01_9PROT|nr:uroporphyrinogen-III synthase [Acidocella aminolytica]GAN81400.1 uroporphyrinogen III synthase [Acidocella aminolytica 101 = DSM 11237]GBQ40875.1 uroporphyrinogen-III synthase [Acidocella aminolytica 101 = DSM 11237]SHF32755.1 uroporphyrinogen-III synthase [Acidocella aminolytica 101 = DSM 11237]
MKLLVTRPEPGASATASRLAAMGHDPVLLPCLAVTPLPPRLPPHPAALVVTSGQAVPALPARLHGVPVFCVGDATAVKLRAAGFTRVESAHGDAVALTKLIVARNVPGLHVLAVGERHGQKLAADLRAAGISVLRRRVYKVAKLKNMPDAVRAALAAGEFDGALFYSAETARAFSQLRPPGTGAMQAYALSQNVAKGLQELPWAAIHVGQAPTEADLMALLA